MITRTASVNQGSAGHSTLSNMRCSRAALGKVLRWAISIAFGSAVTLLYYHFTDNPRYGVAQVAVAFGPRDASDAPSADRGGAVQVDPGFSQLTPSLLSALETKI